jgi:hypothetical protein
MAVFRAWAIASDRQVTSLLDTKNMFDKKSSVLAFLTTPPFSTLVLWRSNPGFGLCTVRDRASKTLCWTLPCSIAQRSCNQGYNRHGLAGSLPNSIYHVSKPLLVLCILPAVRLVISDPALSSHASSVLCIHTAME